MSSVTRSSVTMSWARVNRLPEVPTSPASNAARPCAVKRRKPSYSITTSWPGVAVCAVWAVYWRSSVSGTSWPLRSVGFGGSGPAPGRPSSQGGELGGEVRPLALELRHGLLHRGELRLERLLLEVHHDLEARDPVVHP